MRPERISEPAAEWVHLDSLRPWVKNPRRNDHAAREVAQSIRRFGFGAPLVARRENLEIIAGHTRVKAALLLAREWAEASAEERESWHPEAVQVATEKMLPVRLRDLSEHEAHLLALADNKLGELADWDEPGLADVLGAYGPEDALLAGFTEEELEAIGSVGNDALDAVGHVANDTPPDPPEEPVTKPGDIWILGRHRVVCGDAKDPRCIAAALGDGEARLLLTDPPYNVGYVGGTKDKLTIQNDSMEGRRVPPVPRRHPRAELRGAKPRLELLHLARRERGLQLPRRRARPRASRPAVPDLGQELSRPRAAGLPVATRALPLRLDGGRPASVVLGPQADDDAPLRQAAAERAPPHDEAPAAVRLPDGQQHEARGANARPVPRFRNERRGSRTDGPGLLGH